jgi:Arylsulfotransferase (ASST)
MITSTLSRLSGRPAPAAGALAAAGILLLAPRALALTVSPLNGTPDASPTTQISFLGARSSEISAVAVVGSESRAHTGRLEDYASAPGASFLPSRPFTPGEHVGVSAEVGRPRRRVSWGFTVARQLPNPVPATAAGLPPRPGTIQHFVTEPALQPPAVQVTVQSPEVDPGYIFLTPNHGYGESGPMIIEDSGQLVWFTPAPRGTVAMNLQVQHYEGKPVLVWWQGPIVDGVGWGVDEILGSDYQPVGRIGGGNGYLADLHAIRLTPEGSAYITAYSIVRADLSSAGGSRQAILQDSILQEVDVKTGLVMFEWHAYGHVPLSDSYYEPGPVDHPWDYFHLNSISPDPWPDGNFIISARNTWAAYEIDHHTGAILWQIGGRRSSFRMGPGTGTAWQHDVRWQPDHTLTIFDNGAVPRRHSQSRVIHERIDWARRSVTLLGRDVHNPPILSGSQGDYETLPNGDAFVGWGQEPYFTEFSPSGQILFDAHLIVPGQSYRAFRFPWSGAPTAPPAIAVKSTGPSTATVYASWNGATGVSRWVVRAGSTPTALKTIATYVRTGFETAIAVHSSKPWFAVQALDAAGQVLGTSAGAHR